MPALRRRVRVLGNVLGITLSAPLLPLGGPAAAAEEDFARWVEPMVGTAPVGFVFPGAVRPHGMVQV